MLRRPDLDFLHTAASCLGRLARAWAGVERKYSGLQFLLRREAT